jgi:transposase
MTRRPLQHIRPWSDAEDAALRELVAQGASGNAIAQKLRRSPKTIKSRIKLLKTPGAEENPGMTKGQHCPEEKAPPKRGVREPRPP